MRASSLVIAALGAAIAAAIGVACGSFRDGDAVEPGPSPEASTPDGPVDAAGTDDAGSDAGCRGGRDAGNICGATGGICQKGQTCCLQGATPLCTATSACPTTQVNCASPEECDNGQVCCQVDGGSKGTRCMPSCAWGAPLCEKDGDCKQGEYCRPEDSTRSIAYFHCAPCPSL